MAAPASSGADAAAYADPLGEAPARPKTAARARPADEDGFDDDDLPDDLLPE